jgi:ribosome recycling factor
MHEAIKKKIRERMDKSIENIKDEFKKVRSGRANAGLVEGLVVDYYGSKTPLKQLASISVPEPRLIVIQPWDKGRHFTNPTLRSTRTMMGRSSASPYRPLQRSGGRNS